MCGDVRNTGDGNRLRGGKIKKNRSSKKVLAIIQINEYNGIYSEEERYGILNNNRDVKKMGNHSEKDCCFM